MLIYLLLALAMIFWGLSFIWYKSVYVFFNPITVVYLRLIISSVLLFGIAFIAGKLQKIEKRDFKFFLLAAFFEPFVYFLGESFGMKYISPTLASIIVALIPLLAPIAARFFYHESLSLLNIFGLIVSVVGVALVVFEDGMNLQASPKGILLMLLAVFGAISYAVCVKRLTQSYNSFTIVAWQNFLGFFMFTPLFFIVDFHTINFQAITLDAMVPVIKLAVFASTLAFMFFTMGIAKIGITRANIFTNLIPVFTAVFAWLLLGESFGIMRIAGIVVVLSGLMLSQMHKLNQIKQRIFQK
jgi:drug/metabolite transporter (DMT)-like permease